MSDHGRHERRNDLRGTVRGNNNNIANEYNAGRDIHLHQHGDSDRDEEWRKMVDWLSALNSRSIFHDVLNAHQEDTSEWFLTSPEYTQWKVGEAESQQVLWCRGNAGAGKSTLMAVAVNNVETEGNGDCITSCIFFQREQHQDVTLSMLMSEILSQLICMEPSLIGSIPHEWAALRRHGSMPSIESLRTTLVNCIKQWDTSYLVCDALDECPEKVRRRFILEIFRIQNACPKLRLLFASRDLYILGEGTPLEDAPFLFIRAREEDLELYVRRQIDNRENLRCARRNTLVTEDMVKTLIRQADGMFLLVKLLVELLDDLQPASASELRELLASLPGKRLNELDAMYRTLWERIAERSVTRDNEVRYNLGMDVMLSLAFSIEPIHDIQLGHALAAKNLTGSRFGDDVAYDSATILGRCLGLVIVNGQGLLQFVHNTAEAFFAGYLASFEPQAHLMLASACVRYLMLDNLPRCEDFDTITQAVVEFPFLSYAATFWAVHTKRSNHLLTSLLIEEFLDEDEIADRALRLGVAFRKDMYLRDIPSLPTEATGIHLAAYHGLLQKIWLPSLQIHPIDEEDSNGWTPLRWAAFGEHEETVQYLIESGCDIDQQDVHMETTLMWALNAIPTQGVHYEGSATIDNTMRVIQGNAYALTKDNVRPRRLVPARCSHKIVDVLIRNTYAIDIRDNIGMTALHRAARNHQMIYAKNLISRGANINFVDFNGHNPLLNALLPMQTTKYCPGFSTIAKGQCWLMRGDFFTRFFDRNLIENRINGTCPSTTEDEDILLQMVGTDVESTSRNGFTLLGLAALLSYPRLVAKLLDGGANVNRSAFKQFTPLMLACMLASPDHYVYTFGELLAEEQANIQLGCIFTGASETVEKDILISIGDYYKDKIKTCQILLQGGADPDHKTPDGQTAFSIALSNGFHRISALIDFDLYQLYRAQRECHEEHSDDDGAAINGIYRLSAPVGKAYPPAVGAAIYYMFCGEDGLINVV